MHKEMSMTRSGRWLSLLLAFTGTLAVAAPATFGGRSIEIPSPERYVPVAAAVPKFIEIAQGFLPATNRLVEVYMVPADRAALARGNSSCRYRAAWKAPWCRRRNSAKPRARWSKG